MVYLISAGDSRDEQIRNDNRPDALVLANANGCSASVKGACHLLPFECVHALRRQSKCARRGAAAGRKCQTRLSLLFLDLHRVTFLQKEKHGLVMVNFDALTVNCSYVADVEDVASMRIQFDSWNLLINFDLIIAGQINYIRNMTGVDHVGIGGAFDTNITWVTILNLNYQLSNLAEQLNIKFSKSSQCLMRAKAQCKQNNLKDWNYVFIPIFLKALPI